MEGCSAGLGGGGRSRRPILRLSTLRCRALRSLLTLESGSLQVSHTQGELELELTVAKFKMVAMADSAFVADQWAQAITSITLTLTPTPHP